MSSVSTPTSADRAPYSNCHAPAPAQAPAKGQWRDRIISFDHVVLGAIGVIALAVLYDSVTRPSEKSYVWQAIDVAPSLIVGSLAGLVLSRLLVRVRGEQLSVEDNEASPNNTPTADGSPLAQEFPTPDQGLSGGTEPQVDSQGNQGPDVTNVPEDSEDKTVPKHTASTTAADPAGVAEDAGSSEETGPEDAVPPAAADPDSVAEGKGSSEATGSGVIAARVCVGCGKECSSEGGAT